MSVSRILPALVISAAMVQSAVAVTITTADLFVSKSSVSSAPANSDVTFSVTVGNGGPEVATTVTLTDPLPAGMTFVSEMQTAGPAFVCTPPPVGSGGTITCTIASLAAGDSASFDFVANLGAAAPGTTFTNQAMVGATLSFDPNSENDSSTSSVTIPAPQSDVGVTKTAPDTAGPDTDVVYTISVTSGGPDAGQPVTLTDTLPGSMTFVSFFQNTGPAFSCTTPMPGSGGTIDCSISSLAAGASATFTLTGHIPPGTASGTSFPNTATVSAPNDPNSENDSSGTFTTVTTTDLTITKSGPATATSGNTFSYTITATNNGLAQASNVAISDTLPAGLSFSSIAQGSGRTATCTTPAVGANGIVNCTVPSLQPGESATFTLVVRSDPAAGGGSTVTNTATVSSTSIDSNPANNSSSSTTTFSTSADLSVTKTATTTVLSGSNITYLITVANGGPSDAQTVTLTDALPAGTTFVSESQTSGPSFMCINPPVGAAGTTTCTGTLAATASAQFTVMVQVAPTTPDGAIVSNTTAVSSVTTDPATANNSSTAMTTVSSPTDLAVIKTGPATATTGSVVSYTVTVTNGGSSAVSMVVLTDSVPAGATFASESQTAGPAFACTTPAVGTTGTINCSVGSFAAGATATFAFGFQITAAPGATITNTANVTSTTADPNTANNSSSAMTTVTSQADLAVTKSGPSQALPGSTASYAITVVNNGGTSAATVTLTDALPAGTTFVSEAQTAGPAFTCATPAVGSGGTVTCTAASLPSTASASFTLVVQIGTATPVGSTVSNTATVTTSSTDANPANDSATATTGVVSTIPTLSAAWLALLGLALSMLGWTMMKR